MIVMAEENYSFEMDGQIFFMLDNIRKDLNLQKENIQDRFMLGYNYTGEDIPGFKDRIEKYLDENKYFSKGSDGKYKGKMNSEQFWKDCGGLREQSFNEHYGNPEVMGIIKTFENKIHWMYNKYFDIYEVVEEFNEYCSEGKADKESGEKDFLFGTKVNQYKEHLGTAINDFNNNILELVKFMEDNKITYRVPTINVVGIEDSYRLDLERNIKLCNDLLQNFNEIDDDESLANNVESLSIPVNNLAAFVNLKVNGDNRLNRMDCMCNPRSKSINGEFYQLNAICASDVLETNEALQMLGYRTEKLESKIFKTKIRLKAM